MNHPSVPETLRSISEAIREGYCFEAYSAKEGKVERLSDKLFTFRLKGGCDFSFDFNLNSFEGVFGMLHFV